MMRKTFFTDLFLISLWTNKYQLLSDHYFFSINYLALFRYEAVLTYIIRFEKHYRPSTSFESRVKRSLTMS